MFIMIYKYANFVFKINKKKFFYRMIKVNLAPLGGARGGGGESNIGTMHK